MPAAQALRSPRHGGGVQGTPAAANIAAQEGVRHRAVVDDVAIELAHRVAVGVEAFGHLRGAGDDDIVGQVGVDGLDEYDAVQAGIRVEIGNLADGMNAGIGAAAGVEPDLALR